MKIILHGDGNRTTCNICTSKLAMLFNMAKLSMIYFDGNSPSLFLPYIVMALRQT